MLDWSTILADELVFLQIIRLFANRLMCQGKHVAAAQRPALIIFAAPEFCFLMEVIADEAAAVRLQPGCWDFDVSLAVTRGSSRI